MFIYDSVANPVPKFIVESNGTLTANGDLRYNGSTSLTSQMATLNGYRTNGNFLGTSHGWVSFFTIPSNARAF